MSSNNFKTGETIKISNYKYIDSNEIDEKGHPAVILGHIDNGYIVAKLQSVKHFVPERDKVEKQIEDGLTIEMSIENGVGESYFYFGEVYKVTYEQTEPHLNKRGKRLRVKDDDVINIFNLIYQKHSWLLNNHLYFKYLIEKHLKEFIDNNDIDEYIIKNYKILEPIYKDYELNTKVEFDEELIKSLTKYKPSLEIEVKMLSVGVKNNVLDIQNRMREIIKNNNLYYELERKYLNKQSHQETNSSFVQGLIDDQDLLEKQSKSRELIKKIDALYGNSVESNKSEIEEKEEIVLEQEEYQEEDYSYDNFPILDR